MQHILKKFLMISSSLLICSSLACGNTFKTAEESNPQQLQEKSSSQTTCSQVNHTLFDGVVRQEGLNFTLQTQNKMIPLWAISQNQAVSPRSPDLSSVVGQQVKVCGHYDGSALYETHLFGEN